jgi:threonine dehydrogenase-like Zn-dependent dehydrogenase
VAVRVVVSQPQTVGNTKGSAPLPDVLEGRIEPGRVFDRSGSIEDVPDGYRAMNDREVLKFQIKP